MKRASARRRPVVGALLLAPVLGAAAGPVAAACEAPWLALGLGVEHSRWRETSALGRTLVSETGTLRGPALGGGVQCGRLETVVRLTHVRGGRDYEGLSSVQVPLRTRTEIERFGVDWQGFVPLGAGWSGAGRVGLRRIDREIASVGRTQGYPERFYNAELAVGARLATAAGTPLRGTAIAWLGAGPPGRLELRLPGADPARLRVGGPRSLEFELQVQAASAVPGWHWLLQLAHRRERWPVGEAQVITRQGVPVAGAVQPATRQTTTRLQAELRFDF